MIVVVGLSYRTAPVEVREKLASAELPSVLARLATRAEVREALFLSTCNRVEIFAEGAGEEVVSAVVDELVREGLVDANELRPYLYEKRDHAALMHIYRVTTSLESMVVGEPQILGQVKLAHDAAQSAGLMKSHLGRAMQRAFLVAKRVRTETALGEGLVSVSSVAVDLARSIFGDLSNRSVLLLGAGEMGEAAARSLGKDGKHLRIVNRSKERAEELRARVGGEVGAWEQLEDQLAWADVVVVSTGSAKPVVTEPMIKRVMKKRKGRTLLLVDIAVPRNVEPRVHTIDNVYVYDIDDLESQVAEGLSLRRGEIVRAEKIIDEELLAFSRWSSGRMVSPILVTLRAKTRAVFISELERTMSTRLRHLSEGDRHALLQMVESAVKKHLHAPTTRLKDRAGEGASGELAEALKFLFDLPDVRMDEASSPSLPPDAEPSSPLAVDSAAELPDEDERIH